MKWLKAVIGVAVIGGFVYGVWFIREKKIDVPFITEASRPVEVKDGMEVPLVLLTPLDSGGTEEGKAVKFVVSEDIKGEGGKTVIEQGAIATGKVVHSRAGTIVGALTNQPARLEIDFEDVTTVDGKKLKLRGNDPNAAYVFDQANTKIEDKPNVVDAISDPKTRDLMANMAKQIATGHEMSADDKKRADDQLKDLASRYGLESTTAFLRGSQSKTEKKSDVTGMLESVQKGDIKGLTGVDLLLAARAAGEILEIGSGLDKSLRGMFKGNNIHAKVGTPVKAYLGETARIMPKRG